MNQLVIFKLMEMLLMGLQTGLTAKAAVARWAPLVQKIKNEDRDPTPEELAELEHSITERGARIDAIMEQLRGQQLPPTGSP